VTIVLHHPFTLLESIPASAKLRGFGILTCHDFETLRNSLPAMLLQILFDFLLDLEQKDVLEASQQFSRDEVAVMNLTRAAPLLMKFSSILENRTERLLRPGTTAACRTYSFLMSSQVSPERLHCQSIRSRASQSSSRFGIGRALFLRPSDELSSSSEILASAAGDSAVLTSSVSCGLIVRALCLVNFYITEICDSYIVMSLLLRFIGF
jgi:hypothetical protein